MVKPLVSLLAVGLALSACTLGLQTAESQRELAKGVALRYLARQHSPVPPDATTSVTLSEWIPEMADSELIYVVDVKIQRGRKQKTLYSVSVNARRMEVATFNRMGVLRPYGQ